MAPSRRRGGPSGKTSATAARSAAIQAAEKRRREEQDHIAACMSNNGSNNTNTNTNNNNKQSDDNNNYYNNKNTTSTAKGVGDGDYEYDDDYDDDHRQNLSTSGAADTANETGKKRKKFSLLPPFSANIGNANMNTHMSAASTTTTRKTKSTASSSSSPSVVVTTTKQVPHAQPYCKLVTEDSKQEQQHQHQLQRRQGRAVYHDDDDDDDDEEDDDEDDDDEDDDGCLHCHQRVKNMPRIRVIDDDDDNNNNNNNNGDSENDDDDDDDDPNNHSGCAGNIQVRCDDCRRYICNGCHWCHEFQANHEIRVCDRCDAFYCRGCDEMDQCDDCGEVVCGSCSTLLSCKFCGGGLCEECATACGRCGIVLCSRDAKFAVDCDTCRLSYCLVCLASGSKDPCVRCGHRPSKRMEQLVHLRLKSIYKAFKSSSNSNGGGDPNNSSSSNHNSNNNTSGTSKAIGGSGGMSSNMNRSNSNPHGNSSSSKTKAGHGGRSRRNKPTTLQDMVGDHDDEDGSSDPTMSMMMGAAAGVLPHKFCQDLEQNYLAEQKKADAAADALLAELEEEEEIKEKKKSKKKKKKERKSASKHQNDDDDDDDNDDDALQILDSDDEVDLDADLVSETDSTEYTNIGKGVDDEVLKDKEGKIDPIEKELVECVNNFNLEGIEDILFRLKGVPGRAALRKNAKKALKRLKLELNPPPPAPSESEVEVRNKANEKKAAISANRSSSTSGKNPAIAMETKATSKRTSSKAASSPGKTNLISTKSSNPKSSVQKSNDDDNRNEAVVEIVSRLVGWMIGKNGQRIRDLMEESGAKIWIDQEKFKGQETRNVYISGDPKHVDQAVLLVKDVITNAPPPQGSTATAAATATTAMASMSLSSKPVDNASKTTGLVASSTSDRPTVSAGVSGTTEVKSAWGKASESNVGVDTRVAGTVPKPPAIISASASASTSSRVKEHAKAQITSEPGIESTNNEEVVEMPLNDNFGVDVVNPAVTSSLLVKPKHKSGDGTTEIVACEARFVPLLIGKRGWTIKHIQDDSGARVDIDQTVTPRQVRISGSKANVDKAVTMVKDVLSYPHAQLQSSEEMDDDEYGVLPVLTSDIEHSEETVPVSTPTKHKLLAASAVLEHDATIDMMPRQKENGDRIQSPPPMVGDAKSAISASSSLSSTPEPSMASSSKGFIASHLQNGPLLPPATEQYNSGSNPSQPVPRPFLQPEMAMSDAAGARGLWPSSGGGGGSGPRVAVAPQPLYAGSAGQIGMQGVGRMVMPQGPVSHPQIQQQLHQQQNQLMYSQGKPALQMNNGLMHEQQHLQNNHNHRQQQIPQSFGPTSQVSHRMPMGQSSQFNNPNIRNNIQPHNIHSAPNGNAPYNLYSNEGLPAARAIATTPLRDLMHHTGGGGGGGGGAPAVSSPMRTSGFRDDGSRLWNSGNPPYSSSGLPPQPSGLQPRSSSGYNPASMGFTSQHQQQLNETGPGFSNPHGYNANLSSRQTLQNTNTLPVRANTATNFSGSNPSGQMNDDSLMIDSLFGGHSGIQSSNVAANNSLLTGFNGLSLPSESDGIKTSGLWGSSALTEGWCQNEGSGVNDSGVGVAAPNVSSIGNIFSNDRPNSQDGPEESRFNWNPSNANR